jgi:hypothetical protein
MVGFEHESGGADMATTETSTARWARLVTAAGVLEILIGAAAWAVVRAQLGDERVVIPSTAGRLRNKRVRGPMTALAQAELVRQTALRATDGRTYGEMAEDDPMARMALEAALIRSSLFTSILAFSIAAMHLGLGAVLVIIGRALSDTSRRATAPGVPK